MVAVDQQILRHTRLSLAVLLIALLGTLVSCKENDGEIGDLYGQWILSEMTIDGQPAPIECTDYSWRFQSDVVCITLKLPYHEYQSYFGSWERSGDRLLIDFTYAPEGASFSPFNPPPGLRLSGTVVDMLRITDFTHDTLRLEYTDDDGAFITYLLKKLS